LGAPATAGAATSQAGATPAIRAVHFSRIGQNMHIEVDGAGFGAAPQTMPFTGGTNYFTFTDVSQGSWTAGGSNSSVDLQYTSWTDTRIVIDGFGTQYGSEVIVARGDNVTIMVKNATSSVSATWTGTLQPGLPPPLDPGGPTPIVAAVHFSRIGQNMHIEVDGAGFGAAPQTMPFTGGTNYFTFTDVSQGKWTAGGSNSSVDLQYTSWTDTRIVIDGFGTQYGSEVIVAPGDNVSIYVQNATSKEFSIWTVPLQAEAPPPLDPDGPTPQVAAVHFSRIGQNMRIEVDGAGFGAAPQTMPFTGGMNYFTFTDVSQGKWTAGGSNSSVDLQYTSWTDTRIVIDGFGTQYGSEVIVVPGDNVSIYVQNATSKEFSIWTVPLRPGTQLVQAVFKPGPGPAPKPSPLRLTSPAQNAVVKGDPAQFSWTAVPGAVTYYLQVYLDHVAPGTAIAPNASMNIAWQGSTATYSLDTTHLLKGIYRWRVAVVDKTGALIPPGWTAERTFTLS
jgi:protein involved in polysaccharide export with SLBB domain